MTDNAAAEATSTDPLPRTAACSNLLLASINPIPEGLIAIGMRDCALLPHVRNALTILALKGGNELGLPMPRGLSMTSVYVGNPRRIEQARILADAGATGLTLAKHAYESVGVRGGFSWCGDAGLHILRPLIERAEGWLSVEQYLEGPVAPDQAEAMIRLRQAAKQAGVRVMLFLTCTDGLAKSRVGDICDEAIEVEACEPDPGVDIAFSIDCLGLDGLHSLGLGRTMCSVRVSDSTIRHVFESFVAPDLESRVMWLLRGQGKSLAEIGAMLKRNKTTVLRRLTGLPAPRRVKLADGWLEACLECLPVAESSDNHGRDGSGAGDEARTRAKS